MTTICSRLGTRTWFLALALFLFGVGLAFGQKQGASADPADSQAQGLAEGKPVTTYAGTETCLHCHKDAGESVLRTAHSGPYDQGANLAESPTNSCDACHGSGKAHAEAELEAERNETKNPQAKLLIFDFERGGVKPEDVNKRCLVCHASGPTHINTSNSFHRLNDLSCISCHSPHHAETKESLLKKPQPELCYSCHLQVKSQFNMPFRHRVNEGLINCTDCHDQHGTSGAWESSNGLTRQVRTASSGDFVCFKCHADKQGPFVFEHAAVKTEGCSACHIAHGGANPRMLKYSNIGLLCLSCHTAASFGHAPVMDPQMATQQNSCQLCHTQIHGSNFNNDLLR